MTNRISPNPALNRTNRVCEKSFKWFAEGYIKLSQDCERSRSALKQCHPSQSLSPESLEAAAAVDVNSLLGEHASTGKRVPSPSCVDANGLALDLEIDVRWI
jgi:hypothetical protein